MRACCVAIAILVTGPAALAEEPALKVPGAYLDAMETGDLDAAGRLFASESSVFESGGQEGTWAHYREHHLGPEIGQIESFQVIRGTPEVETSGDRTMALVAWPIEYKIALKDERLIESRGTVTFVLTGEPGKYRIRHLHWSSRRKKP
jgi:hypothetical protein